MSATRLVTKTKSRFARYGPSDHYESPPPAGMCISVFAVVKRQGKKGVLFGLPRPDNRWPTDWLTSWRSYSEKELSKSYQEWRLPSVYLAEGEHPDEALRRIMKEQIGIANFEMPKGGPRIYSYSAPSDWYPGNNHWDLVFVYDIKVRPKDVKDVPRWWQELGFMKKKEIRGKNFGWNEDLMRDLELLNGGAKKARKDGKKNNKKTKNGDNQSRSEESSKRHQEREAENDSDEGVERKEMDVEIEE
jgi:ADP-ribose pyrophosphatase YjhB (NUDIX family)